MAQPQRPLDSEPPPKNLVGLGLAAIWRFRLLIVAAGGIGACYALFGALVTPDEYRSMGKLFVKPSIRETVSPEAAFSGADANTYRLSVREAIQNEMQVLSSQQFFEKVAERLGGESLLTPFDPASNDDDSTPWHIRLLHSFQSWWFDAGDQGTGMEAAVDRTQLAAMFLANSIAIYPETGANVITVSYVSHSPDLARRVVNATLEAAIAMHTEVFNTMASLTTIEREAESAEELARKAEEALREFRIEKDIYDFEAQRNALLDYLGDLDRQIDQIQVEADRIRGERDQLETLAQGVPKERTVVGTQAFILNPTYSNLQTYLFALKRAELDLDFQGGMSSDERKRRLEELQKRIAEVEKLLKDEGMQLKLDTVKEESPYFASLRQQSDAREIELKGLESKKQQLEAARISSRQRLEGFEALHPMLRKFENEARQKRAAADRLAGGVASIRVVQRLEQLNLSDLTILQPGTFDPYKIGPVRTKRVVLGGIVGVVAGLGLAVLLALLDRRVRNREDVVWLGIPPDDVLASRRARRSAAEDVRIPEAFRDVADDIAWHWTRLPYDRRGDDALKIAFLPCGQAPDASRAAATLAMGLAAKGGERVVYVSCADDGNWFATRLGIDQEIGWSEALAGGKDLAAVMQGTPFPGLVYLPMGRETSSLPHPMASAGFAELLDRLGETHRFVVVELPDPASNSEALGVLGIVDAVQLVVAEGRSDKAAVREAIARAGMAGAHLLGAVLQTGASLRRSRAVAASPVLAAAS